MIDKKKMLNKLADRFIWVRRNISHKYLHQIKEIIKIYVLCWEPGFQLILTYVCYLVVIKICIPPQFFKQTVLI